MQEGDCNSHEWQCRFNNSTGVAQESRPFLALIVLYLLQGGRLNAPGDGELRIILTSINVWARSSETRWKSKWLAPSHVHVDAIDQTSSATA